MLASAGSRVRLRNLRRLEELSTAPKTLKCRLLDPRPAGCGERTGVLGRGCHIPLLEDLELPASDTALLLAAWFCWACGDVVPFHQSSVVVASLSIPPSAVASQESRLLCHPEAWEGGNPAHCRGHALVIVCFIVLPTDLSQVEAVPRSWPMMCRLPPNQTRPPRSRA